MNKTVGVETLDSTKKTLIKETINLVVEAMLRKDSERDLIKDKIDSLSKEVTVEPKVLRRLAKAVYTDSFNDDLESNNRYEEYYKELFD